jgi:hypothetical protein
MIVISNARITPLFSPRRLAAVISRSR